MIYFLNNCLRRDHAGIFGADAFYDLNRTGGQARMATGIRKGDECVVAVPEEDGSSIVFSWYTFSHEAVMPKEDGESVRVFFGKLIRSEKLAKAEAAVTEPYSVFLNVNGHFKRPSVIQGKRKHPSGKRI